ncbi:hypothetical protein L249_3728 [Ophiocordyceps polyrhachis-furcata BCC 54312]|uniref:Uncharacterized protein n=1 Tax=Ophiocordyceps polyrhachis-furcata BCC 54312 TaxID=1330021 RepID=A0A367L4N1_9HYPO|nr:hypothetical protein L249_3728 [Ophiocordyceps polyrhachis-furcata BCC 54312]
MCLCGSGKSTSRGETPTKKDTNAHGRCGHLAFASSDNRRSMERKETKEPLYTFQPLPPRFSINVTWRRKDNTDEVTKLPKATRPPPSPGMPSREQRNRPRLRRSNMTGALSCSRFPPRHRRMRMHMHTYVCMKRMLGMRTENRSRKKKAGTIPTIANLSK